MHVHRRSKLELRRNFEKRSWQPTESFPAYYHAKIVLANKASIVRDELVDYLIDGIPDGRVRDQARIQQFHTEDDLLKAFANISLLSQWKTFQRKKEGKAETTDRHRSEKKEELKNNTTASRESRLRCYNCSEFGHVSGECTKPEREKGLCFRCGSKKHEIRECQEEARKNQPSIEETTHVIQTSGNIKPFMTIVKYAVTDNCNNTCNFSINAMIDTGSPISLIREDYAPHNIRRSIPLNMTPYYGINKSKINILGIAEVNCIVDNASVKLTFYVVPIETITFAAILGRDYIVSHGHGVSLIDKRKNENKAPDENEQVGDLNDIFQIDCVSEIAAAIEKLNINSRLEHSDKARIERLFVSEYLEIQSPRSNGDKPTTASSSDTKLIISLKYDQLVTDRVDFRIRINKNCRKSWMIY